MIVWCRQLHILVTVTMFSLPLKYLLTTQSLNYKYVMHPFTGYWRSTRADVPYITYIFALQWKEELHYCFHTCFGSAVRLTCLSFIDSGCNRHLWVRVIPLLEASENVRHQWESLTVHKNRLIWRHFPQEAGALQCAEAMVERCSFTAASSSCVSSSAHLLTHTGALQHSSIAVITCLLLHIYKASAALWDRRLVQK